MHTFGPFCYEFENVEEEIVDVFGEHRTAVVTQARHADHGSVQWFR